MKIYGYRYIIRDAGFDFISGVHESLDRVREIAKAALEDEKRNNHPSAKVIIVQDVETV